jgi:hypothetical protein
MGQDEEAPQQGGMTFEDWDKILDAKLLYNLYDDFECRMAALRTDNNDVEYSEAADREEMERVLKALVMFSARCMERVLKALVMFSARCLATCDTALILTRTSLPNTIMLTYIEHLIHAYNHVKGYSFVAEMEDED